MVCGNVWYARMSRSHVESSVESSLKALAIESERNRAIVTGLRCCVQRSVSLSHLKNFMKIIQPSISFHVRRFQNIIGPIVVFPGRGSPTNDPCQRIQTHRLMSHQIAPMGPNGSMLLGETFRRTNQTNVAG